VTDVESLSPPAAEASLPAGSEALRAARNALTLGSSLALSLGIALLVRLMVPRTLGPAAFGELRFAENAAEMVFVALTLGVDMLIRREVAVAPEKASLYVWGLLVLRVLGGAVLIAGVAAVMGITSGPHRVLLFAVLAVAELLVVLNESYSAFEQAGASVGWIAKVNLVCRVVWAVLSVGVLLFIPSGLAFAGALLASETFRFLLLTARSARRYGIPSRIDLKPAVTAIVASLPFCLNSVAYNLYGRMGTWFLASACGDREVGWFGAASNLSSIAMLGMPLLAWVLVPSSMRAAHRSDEELGDLVGSTLRVTLIVSVVLALVFGLGAAFWIHALFGSAYAPATAAMRVIAPTMALAYVSTVCALDLIARDRIWHVAIISMSGIALSAVCNLLFIRWGAHWMGQGGGAMGAAWATLTSETIITAVIVGLDWRRSWNGMLARTGLGLTLGSALACACVGLQTILGALALPLAAGGFVLTMLMTRAVGAKDVEFCRAVWSGMRRKSHAAA
jgi:O-antigen/teichoic acid export membrane protein